MTRTPWDAFLVHSINVFLLIRLRYAEMQKPGQPARHVQESNLRHTRHEFQFEMHGEYLAITFVILLQGDPVVQA